MKAVPTMQTHVGRSIVAAISHPFGVGNSYFRVHTKGPKWVDTIFCGCYRREVFDRVQNAVNYQSGLASEGTTNTGTGGPFNDRLARGQDMELHRRLKKVGGKILLIPATTSIYYVRSDLRFFLSQSWNNGLWAILPFAYCDGVPVAMRHLVPFGFVSTILLTSAIGFILPKSLLACGTILSAYGTANLAASLQVAWRERSFAMVFVVPVIFFILHTGYGLGSLWGAVTVACRGGLWRKIGRSRIAREPAIEQP